MRPEFKVTIPPTAWEHSGPDEDPTVRLLTTLTVNGLPLHLEAWAVKTGDHGCQEAVDSYYCPLDELYTAFEDTCFDTLEIDEREYVLVATPFAA